MWQEQGPAGSRADGRHLLEGVRDSRTLLGEAQSSAWTFSISRKSQSPQKLAMVVEWQPRQMLLIMSRFTHANEALSSSSK